MPATRATAVRRDRMGRVGSVTRARTPRARRGVYPALGLDGPDAVAERGPGRAARIGDRVLEVDREARREGARPAEAERDRARAVREQRELEGDRKGDEQAALERGRRAREGHEDCLLYTSPSP